MGHTRMMLLDILQGYYNLRKVIKKEVGDNESYLVFQAGIKGGFSFLEPMIRKGRIKAGPEGFSKSLSVFTDGGAGNFHIEEMDWHRGWAEVACENSFEAWSFCRKRTKVNRPVCHYNRGIILGFMKATHKYAGTGLDKALDCVEIACEATGQGACRFIIGSHENIRNYGYEGSKPTKSIQQQLKERVWEKTQEIREANRFNERILKNAPVGIITINSKGEIISANPAIGRIFGVPHSNLFGKSLLTKFDSLSADFLEHLRKGLQGDRFDLVDYPLKNNAWGQRFFAIKGIPLKSTQRSIEGLLCIFEDTTQKSLTARRIEYLKNYNENIIQSITQGIIVLDPDLKIKTWNRKMEEIFQIKARSALSKSLTKVLPTYGDPKFINQFQKVIDEGIPIDKKGVLFPSRRRGAITLNLRIIPLFDDRSAVSGIIVLHEDITDREKIEIRYRNLFETAQDGICLTDPNGRIISANKKFLKILGTTWDKLQSVPLLRFLPPNRKIHLQESLELAIKGHEMEPYEVELINKSGNLIPVELSITAVRKGDKIYGLQIISRDIAKRKRMEKQVIQTSKLAAIGELATGVAHEINNPLASVAGYAEEMLDLLREKEAFTRDDLSEFEESLGVILEQAHRCKEITQNLLNLARRDDFTPVFTNVNELIEKALILMDPSIKSNRIDIIKQLNYDLPLIETDPSQLLQVFHNILKNAVESVGSEGVIHVASRSNGNEISVRIRDNGKGISRDNLKKIFDPFFTTKPSGSGTGLGLSICYNIVEKLQGSIEVDSEMGVGSTFTVHLPIDPKHDKETGDLT